MDETDIKLRSELLKSFSTIKKNNLFNDKELKNIQIAIHLFFNEYRAWNRIFKILSPRQCFFLCHYQREGLILAMKRNKVKSIELQHGLIAPEDIFYMFPDVIKPIREHALFADEIWVYGKFWKERLLKGAEYTDEQIKLFGYYLFADKQIPALVNGKLKKLKDGKRVILITTQINLHREYTEYIKFLSQDIKKKNYDYIIWVKPHPAEKINLYQPLIEFDNVHLLEDNLEYLFQYADIHLSIYSTTLYDACRYNLPNFSLYNEAFGDYVNSVVESGVAKLIYPSQNPVELEINSNQRNGKEYFDDCNFSMLSA